MGFVVWDCRMVGGGAWVGGNMMMFFNEVPV